MHGLSGRVLFPEIGLLDLPHVISVKKFMKQANWDKVSAFLSRQVPYGDRMLDMSEEMMEFRDRDQDLFP